jgi:beta-phosphoglucomutase-like phosphatase (HAD superfamily)
MIAATADTPLHRATISELTSDEALALVEEMRQRRMRQHTLYEEALAAKAKIKEERDRARYDQLLRMIESRAKTADNSIDAISKYLTELKLLQLMLGEG